MFGLLGAITRELDARNIRHGSSAGGLTVYGVLRASDDLDERSADFLVTPATRGTRSRGSRDR